MRKRELLKLMETISEDDEILIPCSATQLTTQISVLPFKMRRSVENMRHVMLIPPEGEWGETNEWSIK